MGKSKQRRANEREISRSHDLLKDQRTKLEEAGSQFTNVYQGIQGTSYDPAQAQVGTLGAAAQAQNAQLAQAQGYDPALAQAAQAERVALGEDTGRTNQFANLQVGTAASDARARDIERGVAQTLESGAVTGAGSATALAQAAIGAKEGIRGDIQQQELQNAQLRAQGATSVQQEDLAQRNLARQADIQQGQFNTGLQQQTNLANQSATNQASQFGASANNQFALTEFGAANQLSQFNVGAQNQFAQTQFGAANQFNLANAQSQNQAAQFGAQTSFQASQLQAQGEAARQENQYNVAANLYSQDANRFGAARQAEADRRASNTAFWGGIAGAAIGAVGDVASAKVGG